jgi:hypothetical protein
MVVKPTIALTVTQVKAFYLVVFILLTGVSGKEAGRSDR